jgi:hypothetical protein
MCLFYSVNHEAVGELSIRWTLSDLKKKLVVN